MHSLKLCTLLLIRPAPLLNLLQEQNILQITGIHGYRTLRKVHCGQMIAKPIVGIGAQEKPFSVSGG